MKTAAGRDILEDGDMTAAPKTIELDKVLTSEVQTVTSFDPGQQRRKIDLAWCLTESAKGTEKNIA